MLEQDALETVLGIDGPVATDPEELASTLTITRFPMDDQAASEAERAFADRLVDAFDTVGVEIVEFEETLEPLPVGKALRLAKKSAMKALKHPVRTLVGNGDGADGTGDKRPGLSVLKDLRFGDKVEPGTTVLAVGEGEPGKLPVDYMGDFRDVTIVTVLDQPDHVEPEMPFTDHYETALEMFTYHMTNVVVGVGDDDWCIYNFNGSHPFYPKDEPLEHHLLHSLVPKLAAPIRPPRLDAFDVREEAFDPTDAAHAPIVDDVVSSGAILETSDLYPPGKDLDELPWRNSFYRWAGNLHLDDRSGMSYGFLARQMPTEPAPAWTPDEARQGLDRAPPEPGTLAQTDGGLVATLDLPAAASGDGPPAIGVPDGPRVVRVPPVWVMTLRSGCDKTDPDPETDLVKLGLVDGQMVMATPEGTRVEDGYRPSFDTKVILAHAVGNALIASVIEALDPGHGFPAHLSEEGMALAHWHGYPNPEHLPTGWHSHGADKPHVSCGTPQAGLFALEGKLDAFRSALAAGADFRGDVHIEPQHGSNLTYPTLQELGRFLTKSDDVAGLGNRYLDAYTSKPASVRARR